MLIDKHRVIRIILRSLPHRQPNNLSSLAAFYLQILTH
ncbi:conserved hypothetical protein [Yersinia pestis Angola]|nr:conserved hypothetical protein [Yersinia pestis Angola]